MTTSWKPKPPHVRRRLIVPALAFSALALASLACITARLTLEVTHQEGQPASLDVMYQQALTQSWINKAKEINKLRRDQFDAAGRSTDMYDLLPYSMQDMREVFDIPKYIDQDYMVVEGDVGFVAEKTFVLDGKVVSEDWTVSRYRNSDKPEMLIYEALITLNLEGLEGSIFELRSAELPDPPDLEPAAGLEVSTDPEATLFSLLTSATEIGEQEMEIELWYLHKALRESDPIAYELVVELPGKITQYELNGKPKGTFDGNRVSVWLTESILLENAGSTLTYLVKSEIKDCSESCDIDKHLVWDGNENDAGCSCVCDKGWTLVEGFEDCINCKTYCETDTRGLVLVPEKCEVNQCACECPDPLVMNWSGTECISEGEAFDERNHITEQNGPSPELINQAIEAILDSDSGKDPNELPGWNTLTSRERESLVKFLEDLGHTVDRTRLIISIPGLTTEQQEELRLLREARFQEARDLAIFEAELEAMHRDTIQRWVQKEIGGDSPLVDFISKIPGWVVNLDGTFYQKAVQAFKEEISDNFKNEIKERLVGSEPLTVEDAAVLLAKEIRNIVTEACIDDYFYYEEKFKELCGESCSEQEAEKAHQKALELLREWKNLIPARMHYTREGDVYDRAFRHINPDVPLWEE